MSIERGLNGQPNFMEMFGGIQPSRTAVELARKAMSLGENPIYFTRQAGRAAQEDGRNKVGFFGKAEESLRSLRSTIESIERGRIMNQSSGRFNKKSP